MCNNEEKVGVKKISAVERRRVHKEQEERKK
jgi:hypothetical protein